MVIGIAATYDTHILADGQQYILPKFQEGRLDDAGQMGDIYYISDRDFSHSVTAKYIFCIFVPRLCLFRSVQTHVSQTESPETTKSEKMNSIEDYFYIFYYIEDNFA